MEHFINERLFWVVVFFVPFWKLIALCNNYLDCFGLVGSFWLFMKNKYDFMVSNGWEKLYWLKKFEVGGSGGVWYLNSIDLFRNKYIFDAK